MAPVTGSLSPSLSWSWLCACPGIACVIGFAGSSLELQGQRNGPVSAQSSWHLTSEPVNHSTNITAHRRTGQGLPGGKQQISSIATHAQKVLGALFKYLHIYVYLVLSICLHRLQNGPLLLEDKLVFPPLSQTCTRELCSYPGLAMNQLY